MMADRSAPGEDAQDSGGGWPKSAIAARSHVSVQRRRSCRARVYAVRLASYSRRRNERVTPARDDREARRVRHQAGSRDNPDAFDAGLTKRGLRARCRDAVAHARWTSGGAGSRGCRRRRRAAMRRRRRSARPRPPRTRPRRSADGRGGGAQGRDAKGRGRAEGAPTKRARLLVGIPNLPARRRAGGADENGNVEDPQGRRAAASSAFNKPLQHFEIGERLGLMDFETAAKLSGARFVVLKGALARLERALAASCSICIRAGASATPRSHRRCWCADEVMYGTAQLPKLTKISSRRSGVIG